MQSRIHVAVHRVLDGEAAYDVAIEIGVDYIQLLNIVLRHAELHAREQRPARMIVTRADGWVRGSHRTYGGLARTDPLRDYLTHYDDYSVDCGDDDGE